jgi:hypothetical protein
VVQLIPILSSVQFIRNLIEKPFFGLFSVYIGSNVYTSSLDRVVLTNYYSHLSINNTSTEYWFIQLLRYFSSQCARFWFSIVELNFTSKPTFQGNFLQFLLFMIHQNLLFTQFIIFLNLFNFFFLFWYSSLIIDKN